jgi:phosphopantothenoylcysteine decarboxylase/phosphopantothenate--cysteine ligase
MLKDKQILLGISGGIAAYKSAELVRLLVKAGAQVKVIMTQSAQEFITPLTLSTLSRNQVYTGMFEGKKNWEIEHIALAQWADLLVVAPATANIIGKIAGGIADDLLSTVIMATKAPVLLAPGMNENMYLNPLVEDNIKKLKTLGYLFMEAPHGELACGEAGWGRMAEPVEILVAVEQLLTPQDFVDKHILITAGATREPLDAVRFISNPSTGKMGYALAQAAQLRGAEVTLIGGPTYLPEPFGVKVVKVKTAQEMYEAVLKTFPKCDIFISAAAVSDYKPEKIYKGKLKKTGQIQELRLVLNPDILQEVSAYKGKQILVGFAAESENLVKNAQAKLKAKNLDLIVANDITKPGNGFESDFNTAIIIGKDGKVTKLPKMSKLELAEVILDRLVSGLDRLSENV